jgi:hypothetical protein
VAREYDPHKLSSPRVFLLSMLIFVIIVGFLAMVLYRQLAVAFITNPGLNGLIIGVLGVGMLLGFMQVIRLMPEVSWVNSFRKGDHELDARRDPVLLAPMATLLGERRDGMSISTNSMRSILDSIGNRLDESREISRYLIGLLVFLGLLGTFWGLLATIGSIGDTIQSLDPGSGDTNDILDALKSGLKQPLDGMGTAFSSSLFGLAGSLILGFLDLQSGQAQNRFYTELENWLSSVTDVNGDFSTSGLGSSNDMTAAIKQLSSSVHDGSSVSNQRATEAMANLAEGIQGLVKHMRSEQQLLRDWVESQSTQQKDIKKLLQNLNDIVDKNK